DVRRLQADPGELAHEVRLLDGEARPGQNAERLRPVLLLDAVDLGGYPRDRLLVGAGPESAARIRVAGGGLEQAGRVRSLQVALHALRAQLALVEGELVPGLEADDLVILHQQLDPALLPAEAAVRLHRLVGDDPRVETGTGRPGQVRPEGLGRVVF